MYVGHPNIQTLFSDKFEISYTLNTLDYCMSIYEHLKIAVQPYSEHILYVVEDLAQLKKLQPCPSMNLLICNPERIDLEPLMSAYQDKINYSVLYHAFTPEVSRILRDYYENTCGYCMASNEILNSLFYENGIQHMLDTFRPIFVNPILVFDAGFHLIGATWKGDQIHPSLQKIIDNKGLTDSDYDLLNSNDHLHEKVLKSDDPIQIYQPELGYEQLLPESYEAALL